MKSDFAPRSHAAFTLVEIMIVVVIIGLLAALAIPAIKKVRNNAIEKAMINDARLIAAAAQQVMSENGTDQATAGQIAPFLAGGKLSSGVTCGRASNTVNNLSNPVAPANAPWLSTNATVVVRRDYFFALSHAAYDARLSTDKAVIGNNTTQGSPIGRSAITFTENGTIHQ